MTNHRGWIVGAAGIMIIAVGAITASPHWDNYGPSSHGGDWPMFGQNVFNTGSSFFDFTISKRNVADLAQKWVATTGGDVSARPSVVNGVVYFPDWGGNLWALNAKTGVAIWHHLLSDYGLPAGSISRTSPAIQNNVLYLGAQTGASLLAINASTGVLQWRTELESHPEAIITASPAVLGDVVYTGVASNEEGAAANPMYPCCSFRGSAVAVSASTGKIIWKTYMTPEGYTGTSIWGSNPVVDPILGTVFVGTGNNYSNPKAPAYLQCIADGGTESGCRSPDDHFDSLVALNMFTGKIKWSQRLSNGDDWNVACSPTPGINCPKGSGPDYDFGSAPNEFVVSTERGPKTIVGAGQKSGVYSAFDPENGKMLWATQVGPGSSLGGIEWGSATDGKRVYVAIVNKGNVPYGPNNSFTAGSWAALDAANGKVIWQVADPNGSIDLGPMTVVNGVVYAPSMASGATQKTMFALDAETGAVRWSFAAGSSVNAGAAVVDGVVYWGSGYSHISLGSASTKFYAFSLGGK